MRTLGVALLALVAGLMLALLGIGIAHHHSPIPYWDMWNGGVLFYVQHLDGHLDAWWRFHNEHPNHLARVLFWCDFAFFGGQARMLVAANVLACLGVVGLFAWCTDRVCSALSWPQARWPVMLLLASWLLQWSQQENLVWAFQGVFFLAQWLPCAAFCVLATGVNREHDQDLRAWFWVWFLGLLSWGTMANAIFTFPVLTLVAWRSGLPAKRLALLVFFSLLALAVYAFGSGVVRSDSMDRTWSGAVSWSARGMHLVSLMGGPAKALGASSSIAQCLGLLVLGLAVYQGSWLIRRADKGDVLDGLRGCVVYLVLTAVLTTIGRAQLGHEQAFSSRYQTPMLMLWAALLLLHLHLFRIVLHWRWGRHLMAGVIALSAVGLLNRQALALEGQDAAHHSREVAALAVELGVPDLPFTNLLYPDWPTLFEVASRARNHRIGPFARPQSRFRHEMLGQSISAQPGLACEAAGGIAITPIPDSNGFVRVEGWMKTMAPVFAGHTWFIVSSGRVAGFAVAGRRDPEVTKLHGRAFARNGFTGYVRSPEDVSTWTLWDPVERCHFPLSAASAHSSPR